MQNHDWSSDLKIALWLDQSSFCRVTSFLRADPIYWLLASTHFIHGPPHILCIGNNDVIYVCVYI